MFDKWPLCTKLLKKVLNVGEHLISEQMGYIYGIIFVTFQK